MLLKSLFFILCLLSFQFVQAQTVLFSADFESGAGDNAWIVDPAGTDTASAGMWARGSQPAYSDGTWDVQLEPYSGNNMATGLGVNNVGSTGDVDGGKTTTRSPAINLPASEMITLTYQYYVGSNGTFNSSYARVLLLDSSGTTLTTLFDLSNANMPPNGKDADWVPYIADLSDYAGQVVYLQFEVNDNDSIVLEAAIDNVKVTTEPLTGLRGTAWKDSNDDGLLSSESGLAGIMVELLDAQGLPVDDPAIPGYQAAYRFTDVSGGYAFNQLPPGNYKLRIATPPGDYGLSSATVVSTDNQVDNDNNGIQSEPGRIIFSPVINIASGEIDETIDFGLVPSEVLPEFVYSQASVFNWRNTANTSGATWNASDTSRTWTINYSKADGNPDTIDVTMSIVDPANRNNGPNARQASTHPFDPAGNTDPFPESTEIDGVAGTGSIVDPWDADNTPLPTETNGGYLAPYLTVGMSSADASERVAYRFEFSKVVKISNLSVGDIDSNGVAHDAAGGNNGLLSIYESPGNSFQDRVEIYAWRGGVPVAVSFTNGGDLIFSNGTSFSIYNTHTNNNVNADVASATTSFSTATGIDAFEIVYSNGSDDGVAERYQESLYSWWSDGHTRQLKALTV